MKEKSISETEQNIRIFFEGLEDNSAFGFTIDPKGHFVPIKTPCYTLFSSTLYPFVIFEEELSALNEYCYETAETLKRNRLLAEKQLEDYRAADENCSPDGNCTKYELVLSAESEFAMWETIGWHAARHLTALLYAFLERALHTIALLMKEASKEQPVQKPNGRRLSKVEQYLSKIFENAETLFAAAPAKKDVLEAARRLRNSTMHGESFRQHPIHDDFEEARSALPFTLVEWIDTVSYILWRAEAEYRRHTPLL